MSNKKRINKRYYFLQLQEDFFSQPLMKKLRRMAGGSTYTIIYLKLQLLSLKNGGYLFYEGFEDEIYEELSITLDETVEDVQMTWMFLIGHGLIIEQQQDLSYFLPETAEAIGSITDSTLRSRKSRLDKRNGQDSVLQCNTTATQLQHTEDENGECVAMQHNCNTLAAKCNPERELYIDIDIEREESALSHNDVYKGVLDNINISISEYAALQEKYENVKQLIDHVSTILANTTPKENHFAYILKIAAEDNWTKKVKRFNESSQTGNGYEGEKNNEELSAEKSKTGMPPEMREELTRKYGFDRRK